MDSPDNLPKKTAIPAKARNKLPTVKHREKSTQVKSDKVSQLTPEELIHRAELILQKAGTSVEDLYRDRHGSIKRFSPRKEKKKQVEISAPTSNPEVKTVETEALPKIGVFETSHRAMSRGFFHYFGLLALLCLIAGSGLYLYSTITKITANDTPAPEEIELVQDPNALPPEPEKIPLEADSTTVTQARKVAEDFINAEESLFAYSFVMQSPKTSPVFEKYWHQQEPFDPDKLEFVRGMTLLDESQWVEFSYKAEKALKIVMSKVPGSNFLIDWHAFSGIESVDFSNISVDHTVPNLIRAWITEDDAFSIYYPSEHWAAYNAYDLDGNLLKCYLPRESILFSKVKSGFSLNTAPHPEIKDKTGVYTKMMVRRSSLDENAVEIIDVTSTSWTEVMDN